MSGGSLSSRVSNMKFMQSAGDRQRREAKDAIEKQETKKLKDLSEWSLPVTSKTMKVIKSKKKKIKKLGYSSISSMGPIDNITSSQSIIGRKSMSLATPPEEKQGYTPDSNEEIAESTEQLKKIKKSKKSKKTKKRGVMDAFKSTSDDEFDPNEVDITSKNLLSLWNAKKK